VADVTRLFARARVPLGYAFAGVVLLLAHPTGRSLLVGTPIAILGEALRIWAAGHLNKSREVTSSGPYRWVGHPLYAGSTVMAAGLVIAANSAIAGALVTIYMAVTVTAAIRSEEAFLRAKFGADYDRYKSGRDTGARERRFSLALAIANREYRAALGLVGVMTLLIARAVTAGTWNLEP